MCPSALRGLPVDSSAPTGAQAYLSLQVFRICRQGAERVQMVEGCSYKTDSCVSDELRLTYFLFSALWPFFLGTH